MERPLPPVAQSRHTPPRISPALALTAALLSACGGGGAVLAGSGPGDDAPQVEVFPVSLQALGTALEPFGVLGQQMVSWRANQPGSYRVLLRPAGDVERELELASGNLVAFERVEVSVRGAQLAFEAPSTIEIVFVDLIGREARSSHELELKAFEALHLGPGEFTDLAVDATRQELGVVDSGTGRMHTLDVDDEGAAFGATVAIVEGLASAGPLRLAFAADGARGYALGGDVLYEIDLGLQRMSVAMPLPSPGNPWGIAVTPDAERVYFGHPETLLIHRANVPGGAPGVDQTGLMDELLELGAVAIGGDATLALYAWDGALARGLWIVDIDPASPTQHQLLAEHGFELGAGTSGLRPQVVVASDGVAAYTLGLSGLRKHDLESPSFAELAARPELTAAGLAVRARAALDHLLLIDAEGAFTVLDEELATLGRLALPEGFSPRSVVDPTGERWFGLRTRDDGQWEVVVVRLD